jgi:hypothetical protein
MWGAEGLVMVFFATFAQFFATFAVSLVLSDVDQNLNRKVRKEIPQRTQRIFGFRTLSG